MIVCARHPQGVLDEICELGWIGNYRLLPRPVRTIHDHYFDTPDRALSTQRLALRIREIAGCWWLALKGAARVTDYRAVERMEIERPWSKDAVEGIRDELVQCGVMLPEFAPAKNDGEAIAGLRSLGLSLIQQHTTRRNIRDVVLHDCTVAELAIDAVLYRFGDMVYRHHEIEIESKGEDSTVALEAVTQALMRRYQPMLRIWYHSKLTTAVALKAVLEASAQQDVRDDNGNLLRVAYDKIDAYLSCTDNRTE